MGAELQEGPARSRGKARKRFPGQMPSCCRLYPTLASFGHGTSKVQEGFWSATPYHLLGTPQPVSVWIAHRDFHLRSAHLLPLVMPVWQQVPCSCSALAHCSPSPSATSHPACASRGLLPALAAAHLPAANGRAAASPAGLQGGSLGRHIYWCGGRCFPTSFTSSIFFFILSFFHSFLPSFSLSCLPFSVCFPLFLTLSSSSPCFSNPGQ